MYKILLFSDGHKHFDEAIWEYKKRLGKQVEIIQLKPSKKREIPDIIKEETDIFLQKIVKLKGYKIFLDNTWNSFSTQELYKMISLKVWEHSDIIFILWGAYGLDREKIKKYIDMDLSLSAMIFPHGMAFLVLLEQIYRIEMIKKGSGYHHE